MGRVVTLDNPLAPGEVRCVQGETKPVAVWNLEGTYFACEDFCPHLGGPLSEGTIEGTTITCPWHGAVFDLTTGKPLSGPAKRDLKLYTVTKPKA